MYITLSVPINKELQNDKIITYKTKFIDSFRFISSSLSSFLGNLFEGLHNNRCKDCKFCLKYIQIKDNQLIFKCIECNKKYEKESNEDFIKRFANTYEFC